MWAKSCPTRANFGWDQISTSEKTQQSQTQSKKRADTHTPPRMTHAHVYTHCLDVIQFSLASCKCLLIECCAKSLLIFFRSLPCLPLRRHRLLSTTYMSVKGNSLMLHNSNPFFKALQAPLKSVLPKVKQCLCDFAATVMISHQPWFSFPNTARDRAM